MNDIVIDTNVLLHTHNKENKYYQSANETLKLVLKRDLSLCLDDVFDIEESKNTSTIGSEYYEKIRSGTFAYFFLMDRFSKGKYVQIIKKNHKQVKQDLNKMIKKGEIKNHHDIAFVITAYGSQDKMLVSNDYDDFNNENRKYIQKRFQVSILDSDEYTVI
jgi:predicted nucleic acid-binding protein